MGLAALLVVTSSVAAQDKMTAQERRELEQKLQQLRQEMRELERKLGREDMRVFTSPRALEGPMAFTLAGGRPRLGVVVKTDGAPATDSIGAVLEAVTPDGPSAKAGLQSGDIVVTFRQAAWFTQPDAGSWLTMVAAAVLTVVIALSFPWR